MSPRVTFNKEIFSEFMNAQRSLLRISNLIHSDLADELNIIETIMEDVRKDRAEAITAFENFDQKSSQLFQLLSTVLKSIREMSSSVARNML